MTGFPPLDTSAPLYMTPPSTEAIQHHISAGRLGAITTPAQGNRMREGWWWCADNGVFGGAYPGHEAFLTWLRSMRHLAPWCLFVVAPDVVGDAFRSISRSYEMLGRIRDLGFPVALVAQDRMEFCDFWDWDDFDALFVGGSTAWKLSDAAGNLARVARSIGKHVHVGRVSSLLRSRIARDLHHAHTIDGTYITRAPDKNLARVLAWRRAMLAELRAGLPAGALPLDLRPAVARDLDPYDGAYQAGWDAEAAARIASLRRAALTVPEQLDLLSPVA
ncbi:hypothetical protein ITP53_11430 [Nonomuraea sp. K274]|uniref:Uncharacterized protein n=1 Tax=Nonomuraea cypriaca TaxID=1187855 RepID=A0A931EXK8_9ACTN|nr:hypothetical protein [Nonomuraea cypriaca]MBF8186350.1 hypothetical protein [Nonomuraea cypriaca]